MNTNISVANVIERLPSRFIKENAKDIAATFQFILDDEQNFYITIDNEACTAASGEHPDPNLTLLMDAQTMIAVITGQTDGMSAFMSGRLKAEGNVILATKLGKLFSREKQV